MCLGAISTPDASLDLARLSSVVDPKVFTIRAKLVNNLQTDDIPYNLETVIKIKDVTDDPIVVDGVSLMKIMIAKSQFNEMREGQQRKKRLYDRFWVTYKWNVEDVRMLAKDKADIEITPACRSCNGGCT